MHTLGRSEHSVSMRGWHNVAQVGCNLCGDTCRGGRRCRAHTNARLRRCGQEGALLSAASPMYRGNSREPEDIKLECPTEPLELDKRVLVRAFRGGGGRGSAPDWSGARCEHYCVTLGDAWA